MCTSIQNVPKIEAVTSTKLLRMQNNVWKWMAVQIRHWLPSSWALWALFDCHIALHLLISTCGCSCHVRINLLFYGGIVTLIFHTLFPQISLDLPQSFACCIECCEDIFDLWQIVELAFLGKGTEYSVIWGLMESQQSDPFDASTRPVASETGGRAP